MFNKFNKRAFSRIFKIAVAVILISVSASSLSASKVAHASALPAINTVFVILMENHNWSDIVGSASAPYINNTLLPVASHATRYMNPPSNHPSLPNYLWIEAGTNFGIADDNEPKIDHQSTNQHLTSLLDKGGISWKSYQEGIDGTQCPLTANASTKYAPKHNPMVYFDDVTNTNDPNSANCIAHVRPYPELASDLQNKTVAAYNFITPNLCDDMHDSAGCITTDSVSNGDTWLSTEVPKILNSQAYQKGGALFITWDEGEGGSDGPVGMIVLSPLAQGGGYSNAIPYTHSSLLLTLEEIFGTTTHVGASANATDLSDLLTPISPTATPIPSPTSTSVPLRTDTIGIYRAGTFYMRNHNTTGFADIIVAYNPATQPYPIVGDWTGGGIDTIGVYDQSNGQFMLRNSNTPGAPDETFGLGIANDQPLSGRWQASAAHSGVGVFRPSNGLIYLKNALSTGFADYTMVLGIPGDVGVAGDWQGQGYDSPGAYRPSTTKFYLSNQVTNGSVFGDYEVQLGIPDDVPIVGDWIGQGHDGIGVFRVSNGLIYMKDALTTGYANRDMVYGIANDVPVAGHWSNSAGVSIASAVHLVVPNTPSAASATPTAAHPNIRVTGQPNYDG